MRIDIDRRAILAKDTPIINAIKASKKEGGEVSKTTDRISGLRRGKEIFLPPSTITGYLSIYLHEVGHVIGDTLSFQADKDDDTEVQVLSFDDVKNSETVITLSDHEIAFLKENIFHGQIIKYSDAIPSIANKLLKLFTKGSFNPSEIKAHFVSQERLEDLVLEQAVRTLSQDDDEKIYAVNSKDGRNDEIPAHVTQFCCMQILENTLKHYNILANYQEFQFPTTTSPSHQRSINLVNRAFLGKDWRLPSMKDTINKNSRREKGPDIKNNTQKKRVISN